MRNPQNRQSRAMEIIHPEAAAIDVAAEVHYVAVNPNRAERSIREFPAFTDGIHALIAFLVSVGATTVALESTGSYWQVLYTELAKAGLNPVLIDPRRAKKPGRKSDVADSEWLRQLHVLGQFDGSFVPTGEAQQLRDLMRWRWSRITRQKDSVIIMQEQLSRMNLKLQHVVRDIAGKTGMDIIDAILKGERDADTLAKLRDPRCRSDERTIARSLEGTWRPECLRILSQAREDHLHHQAQIERIDMDIERVLQHVAASRPVPADSTSPTTSVPKRSSNKHAPAFNAHSLLQSIFGVDLTTVPGITATSLLKLVGEIGFGIESWRTSKHFASWLKLCPDPRISGKKILTGHRNPTSATRAAQCLKEMAMGLQNDQGPLGQRFRACRARKGHDFAIKATAHQLAVVIYAMIRSQRPYDPTPHEKGLARRTARRIATLKKQAQELGYTLQPAA